MRSAEQIWVDTRAPAPPGFPCRFRGRAMDESEELKRVRTWEFGEPMSRAMLRCNGPSGVQETTGRPAPLPFSTPPTPAPTGEAPTLQRDIYLHTCIQIRFSFNPFHVGKPARPNRVACISLIVHLLDLLPTFWFSSELGYMDKVDLRVHILQLHKRSFFASQNSDSQSHYMLSVGPGRQLLN
ncbi:hypothetical protein SEVIR_3G029801v4 [Setaria viridis]|uniref:Uncharacterized protein n=1 Tax=Setaria viridis TaxID=4556 RepID=A0A4U6VIP4_SETVI|nr:hypothetical protein SEVIR_3G029801v2 [Setaria viridis]TKW24087.1 hypothetical protein SEVIR_3G029801v2 [Setaria viridis]